MFEKFKLHFHIKTHDLKKFENAKAEYNKKMYFFGVPVVAQWLTNPTRNHEVSGSIPGLAQWVGDPALP